MKDFFVSNREIIIDILAILAFIISTFQLICSFLCKKTNINVAIQETENFNLIEKQKLIFKMLLENNSSEPIAITRIFLIVDSNEYSCELNHKWIGEHYYPKYPETDTPCTERKFSADFPIQMEAKSAISSSVLFELPFNIDKSQIVFYKLKVVTNKKSKIFKLPVYNEIQYATNNSSNNTN